MVNYYIFAWGILISTAIIFLFHLSMRNMKFLIKNGLSFFILCGVLCLLRVLLPFDFSGKRIIEYPAFLSWFMKDRYLFSGRLLLLDFLVLVSLGITLILILHYHLKLNNIIHTFKTYSEEDLTSKEILEKIAPRNNLPVRKSKLINTPLICGILHPIIYLPYFDFSEEDLVNILLHEYTHQKYHHTTLKYFLHLLVLFFWWNPLMFVFERDISHLLELICDSIVLHSFEDESKLSYIATILHCLDFVECSKEKTVCSAYFMGILGRRDTDTDIKENRTTHRIHYHLNSAFAEDEYKNNILLYSGLILCFLLSFFFMVQPAIVPDKLETFSNEDNSYVVEQKDGSYIFYFEDQETIISNDDMDNGYFSVYPLISYKEYQETGDYKDSPTYQNLIQTR